MCNTVMCSQDVTRWQVIRSLFELFDRTVRSLMAPLENFCWQKRLSRTKSRYQKIDLGILNRNYPGIQPVINSGIPQVPILVPKSHTPPSKSHKIRMVEGVWGGPLWASTGPGISVPGTPGSPCRFDLPISTACCSWRATSIWTTNVG